MAILLEHNRWCQRNVMLPVQYKNNYCRIQQKYPSSGLLADSMFYDRLARGERVVVVSIQSVLSIPPYLDTTLSAGERIELVELINKIGHEILLESNVPNIIIFTFVLHVKF